MTLKYLLIAILLIGVEEVKIGFTPINTVSCHDTGIHHDKFVGKPILIYQNSVVTTRTELLACGDVQANPGPIDNVNPGNVECLDNVSVRRIQYSRDGLLNLNNPQVRLPPQTWTKIQELNLNNHTATHRGRRAGVHAREHRDHLPNNRTNANHDEQIPVLVSNRRKKSPNVNNSSVTHSNLRTFPQADQYLNICSWNARSVRNKSGS